MCCTDIVDAATGRTVELLAIEAVGEGVRRAKVQERVEAGVARLAVQRVAAPRAVGHAARGVACMHATADVQRMRL